MCESGRLSQYFHEQRPVGGFALELAVNQTARMPECAHGSDRKALDLRMLLPKKKNLKYRGRIVLEHAGPACLEQLSANLKRIV